MRRAVLMMRQAISPRLAIRMRLNMRSNTPTAPAYAGFAATAGKCQCDAWVRMPRSDSRETVADKPYATTSSNVDRPMRPAGGQTAFSRRRPPPAGDVGNDPVEDLGVDVGLADRGRIGEIAVAGMRHGVDVSPERCRRPAHAMALDQAIDCRATLTVTLHLSMIVHDPTPAGTPCLAVMLYPLPNGVHPSVGPGDERFNRGNLACRTRLDRRTSRTRLRLLMLQTRRMKAVIGIKPGILRSDDLRYFARSLRSRAIFLSCEHISPIAAEVPSIAI